ncbi:putative transcriptional regulator (LysR family) [Candidatus Competibacter denitrificans Run_A_D11]|uniref:Transcriptional regulator (LysR family) n=1 Tax=Candidatus Competibacter denitrificans Run_A_D11 TaxID=1400863 RepID=W6M4U5_9GAMM|nr:LysR family transcriptional regulator [Candidatus Competibacter denitrificans]CDI01629.1 putative transcriptional regulator (LysR family) [Candidatus Competibacter denitrificans Run_A_D11]HAS86932.1 LysR family transcriptional regulator [Candidatus Competibacteraceae bacterium]HRC69725.1 LysR family transcriptional regulator [Candidatus Competibacter denitrificans]
MKHEMDWSDLRYFLAAARLGRLSPAARRLQVEHSTVSRRIDSLERTMGTRLFERHRDGLVLTEAGHALLPMAEQVEATVAVLSEALSGQDLSIRGEVRLGTPEGLAVCFLTPKLKPLLDDYPNLTVELLALPRLANLASREADLAITLEPPRRGPYVVARWTDYSYFLYGSRDYLDQHGPITTRADLARHPFVAYIDDYLLIPELRFLEKLCDKPNLRFSSTSMLAHKEAVLAGVGLAVLTPYISGNDQRLIKVLPDEAQFQHTFWLAAHADRLRLKRVRLVWDYLMELITTHRPLFLGG